MVSVSVWRFENSTGGQARVSCCISLFADCTPYLFFAHPWRAVLELVSMIHSYTAVFCRICNCKSLAACKAAVWTYVRSHDQSSMLPLAMLVVFGSCRARCLVPAQRRPEDFTACPSTSACTEDKWMWNGKSGVDLAKSACKLIVCSVLRFVNKFCVFTHRK